MKRKLRLGFMAFLICGVLLNVAAQDVEAFPQLGHTSSIGSVAFSPDGKQIISGSWDNTIKLWDTESSREIRTFSGHSSYVFSVAFSPNGTQIISGSGDNTIRLWDLASGQEIRSFSGHTERITSVAFSPDGKQVLSKSWDETVRLWDLATGQEIRTFSEHIIQYGSVAFSPDGRQFLSDSWDQTVRLWDLESGQEIRTFSIGGGNLTFSPNGKQILSGSSDRFRLWDLATGHEIRTFSGHTDNVNSIAFSPDGKQVLSGSRDRTVKLWDLDTGLEITTFSGHTDGINSVVFSPDGRQVLSGSYDRTIKLWDLASGQEVRTFSGHIVSPGSVAFSPDGRQFLSVNFNDTIKLWDLAAAQETRSFSGHGRRVNSIAFSPDGKQFLSGSTDRTVKLWDLATGREIRTFSGHTDNVNSIAFSPDGMHVLSGSQDETIKLWDLDTGQEIIIFSGHTDGINSVVFSPDGRQVLSGSYDRTIKLWDLASGQEVRTFSGHRDWITSVAFSPDGKQVLSGSWDNTVKLWDLATGQEIRTFLGHTDYVSSVAFCPDGKQVISSSGEGDPSSGYYSDRTIKLWDITTGQEIKSFSGHNGPIHSIAFSPDGTQVLSGSQDGTVRLWDASTGQEIASFISFSGSDTQLTANSRGGIRRVVQERKADISGEWIAITPDGYYAASPRGDRYLNVRLGNRVTGIDSFRSIFYRPDIVEARLAGRPDPVSMNTMNIQEATAFFPATVTLQAPSTTTSAVADVSVNIVDDNQPLQNIRILVNGRLVGREEFSAISGAQGLIAERASLTVTGDQKNLSFNIPLVLDPGENLVEFVVFNGFAESRQRTNVTWISDADHRPELPNLWLLAIGVNQYNDESIEDLSFCANDAREIVNSFQAQEGRRFATVNSLVVADGEALTPDVENIRESLVFLNNAGPRDTVLLFMAGHGESGQDGMFFFKPQDARNNLDGSYSNVITGDEIIQVLDQPGNRLIFIDACRSGSLDNDRMLRLFMDTNAYVFASSRGNELSWELPELGHGVFTYSIMNTLRDPEARSSGSISVLGLSGHVSLDVPQRLRNRYPPREQNPVGYSLGFFDFIIGE